jgi:demethylmenaquinone methyltransferase/2-methoxy-6-polyprenyl-1,4-benzoquinol methylase
MPDRAAAIEQYRAAAPGYDPHMRRFARWQRRAVERLELRPGETVIDVACGTGLVFPLLRDAVGPGGRVVGIDLSPDMVRQANERVRAEGWDNVSVIEAPVEEARIDVVADAALFAFTHDVLQLPAAVDNVVDHLRPGARVACTGAKLAGRFGPIVNYFVRRSARPYMTTFAGLDRPWRVLEGRLGPMEHESMALGGAYVAWGTLPEG